MPTTSQDKSFQPEIMLAPGEAPVDVMPRLLSQGESPQAAPSPQAESLWQQVLDILSPTSAEAAQTTKFVPQTLDDLINAPPEYKTWPRSQQVDAWTHVLQNDPRLQGLNPERYQKLKNVFVTSPAEPSQPPPTVSIEQATSETQAAAPPSLPPDIPSALTGAPTPLQAATSAAKDASARILEPFRSIFEKIGLPLGAKPGTTEYAQAIQEVTGAPPQRFIPTASEVGQLVSGTQPEFHIDPEALRKQSDAAYGAATGVIKAADAPFALIATGARLLDKGFRAIGGKGLLPDELPPTAGTLLEPMTAGEQGFTEPQSIAGRYTQNALQNLGAIAMLGGPWKTIVQGVVSSMLGQTVEELQRGPDGAHMNPWLRMGVELVGQVGVGGVQNALRTARQLNQQGMPLVQAIREGSRQTMARAANYPTKAYKSFREALGEQGSPEQQNLAQATNVEQRYPGVNVGIAEGSGSQSLLTAEDMKLPEAQRLALQKRREHNQALVQQQFGPITQAVPGSPGTTVEGMTEVAPLVEQKAQAVLAPTGQRLEALQQGAAPESLALQSAENAPLDLTMAFPLEQQVQAAETAKATTGATLRMARDQQLAARREVLASQQRLKAAQEGAAKVEQQNAVDLGIAQQQVRNEMQEVQQGIRAGETDVGFFERMGQPIRDAYERIKNRWQDTARKSYEDIDPKNAITATAGEVLPILDDIESQATTAFQGKYAPRTLQAVRQAIGERAQQGGPVRVTSAQEAAGQGNILGDLRTPLRLSEQEYARLVQQGALPPMSGTAAVPTPQDLQNVSLSLNDLRRVRSEALKEARSTTDSTARYYLNQLDEKLSGLMDTMANRAGTPGVTKEVQALNKWYRTEGLRFWEGPGADILARTPQGTNKLSNADVVAEYWGSGWQPGSQPSAIAPAERLQTIVSHVGNDPDAMEAIKTFAQADLYKAVVKDGMSIAHDGIDAVDTVKLSAWLRQHESQIQQLPAEAQGQFRNVRTAYRTLQDQERRSEVLLSQAKQPVEAAQQTLQAAQMQSRGASLAATEARQPFTEAAQTLRGAEKQHQTAMAEAVAQHGEAVQAAQQTYTQELNAATKAHNDTQRLLEQSAIGQLTNNPHFQERFSEIMQEKASIRNRHLNELYDAVQQSDFGKQGLLRMMWDDFVSKQTAMKSAQTTERLATNIPLLDARNVKAFLGEHETWLQSHYPDQYQNLVQITDDLAVVQRHMTMGRGALPSAIKPASGVERGVTDLGAALLVGTGVEALRSHVTPFLPPFFGSVAGLAAGYKANLWLNTRPDQRLRLLQDAMFNTDASTILANIRRADTRPEWFRTTMYNYFLREGMLGNPAPTQEPAQ